MRSTLVLGLLVCMPTAALLALAALALLVSHLRRRLLQALNRRFQGHAITVQREVPLADRHAPEQVRSDALANMSADMARPYREAVPAQVSVPR
jgi:hypothetical protein